MGIKGSWRRPRSITREEADLRWRFAKGQITLAAFGREYAELKRRGLIRRSGRILE